jgi:hypothetical protein
VAEPEPDPWLAEELEPGEAILAFGGAKWRENPYQESAGEAEGVLCLTSTRIIFETPFVQPFLSLDLIGFEAAEVQTRRRGVQLVLTRIDGDQKSFWCDLDLAQQVASAVGRSTSP